MLVLNKNQHRDNQRNIGLDLAAFFVIISFHWTKTRSTNPKYNYRTKAYKFLLTTNSSLTNLNTGKILHLQYYHWNFIQGLTQTQIGGWEVTSIEYWPATHNYNSVHKITPFSLSSLRHLKVTQCINIAAASTAYHWDLLILLLPHCHLLASLAHICCCHSSSYLNLNSHWHRQMQMSSVAPVTLRGSSLLDACIHLTALQLKNTGGFQ